MTFSLNLIFLLVVCRLECYNCQTFRGIRSSERNMSQKQEVNSLIPDYVQPSHYDIFLHPNIEEGVFEGNVVINFHLTTPGNYIPVHIKDLRVTNTQLDKDDNNIPIKTWQSEKNQFWVVKHVNENTLQPGSYVLKMSFKGNLARKIVGFYRSTYIDPETKETRNLVTTKFEPVDARQAFPCFDEPALKAKFKIRIVKPKDKYSALSNMNVIKQENGPGAQEVTVHFAETVPMSTYLVCFIVSDFLDSGPVHVDNMGKSIPIKVFATPGQVQNTEFAKKAAAAVIKFYIDYFGVPYSLPKLDLIAIPDFVSGAMENWGLITFRENGLLFNEKENSAANQQRIATVVSHEISHMWFGNLVTMKWWDDLWLNEGFASFMQYKGVDEGIPKCSDWQMLDHAIHDQIHPVLRRDAVASSHPIIQSVNNPNQITEIFDSISYHKGHAVLKMLESFVGESNFKRGIQKYLKAHMFSNAATPDLWAVLNEEVQSNAYNVGNVMDTWTRQMGFPVVTVMRTADSFSLSQSRFMADGNTTYNPNESPYRYTWEIPIFYHDGNEQKLVWLKRSTPSVKVPRPSNRNYIKFNYQQRGFYRVNYDLESWKIFQDLLKNNTRALDRKDRANLLDDAFSLAAAGMIDYSVALSMAGYLKKEREYLPWATASNVIIEVVQLLSTSLYYPDIRSYVGSLVKDLYGTKEKQFFWTVHPNDTHSTRQLRVIILSIACRAGYQPCLDDAGAKFLEWIRKPDTDIHPDIRALVYKFGMRAVGRELEWEIVLRRYRKETNPQEKINLLEALAYIREPWILRRYLELAKNESIVRSQDYFSVLGFISTNPVGNPIVWKFFRNEWPYLVNRFSLYHRNMGRFIELVTIRFSTQIELEEVQAFIKKYPEAGAGENARRSAIENIKNNINWLEKNEATIGSWLKKHMALNK